MERDDPHTPAVLIFDRDLLRTTHQIIPVRSEFFDNNSGFTREECEEVVLKDVSMEHKALVGIHFM